MDEARKRRLADGGSAEDSRGNERGHPAGRIASFLLTGMLVVLAAIALLCWGPRLFGWTTFGVVSNSMAPALWACDLAFVDQTVQPEAMGIGDVAVFHLTDGKVCGHRIVDVDRQARTFATKGDAVAIQDAAPVSFDRVIGQVKGSMAFAGAPLVAYQNHKWLCVGVLSAVVVLLFAVATALGPPHSAKRPSGELGVRGWRSGSIRNSSCERGA